MRFIARAEIAAIGFGLVASFGTMTYSTDADAAWKPKKPVSFVIMACKGCGADKAVR